MSAANIAEVAATVTLAVNLAAGAVAGLAWWRGSTNAFVWPLLRAGQAAVVVQAALAGLLAATGWKPDDGLYWLYVMLPIAINLIAEQLRILAAEQVLENRGLADAQAVGALPEEEQRMVVLAVVRREIGVMAVAAVVVTFLALRAALIA